VEIGQTPKNVLTLSHDHGNNSPSYHERGPKRGRVFTYGTFPNAQLGSSEAQNDKENPKKRPKNKNKNKETRTLSGNLSPINVTSWFSLL